MNSLRKYKHTIIKIKYIKNNIEVFININKKNKYRKIEEEV